ncbi:hypothetical protein [Streptomyces javensis]|uniref:Uncharacterized protein n=1 Tax=Streptomyces javensis TaxID=114698 RepID=A0ABS0R6L7_9ACTN|nr:hypothetical protein [Streptomyces javensis]MBI0313031.1 hypothetical protein [Streptomyces javensis]
MTATARRTPAQVTADRLAVIAKAVDHLDTTDRATLLDQLTATNIRDHYKSDPVALADTLRAIDADSPTGLRYSGFAGALDLLRAAGKDPR